LDLRSERAIVGLDSGAPVLDLTVVCQLSLSCLELLHQSLVVARGACRRLLLVSDIDWKWLFWICGLGSGKH